MCCTWDSVIRSDLLIIAPCTANTIAKLAHGQADSLTDGHCAGSELRH